jgi:hypothetical protein
LNPKRKFRQISFITLIALMLIAWFFVFYLSPRVIFRLTFNPVNVSTNGTVRVEDEVIQLGGIDDFIIVEGLPSGRPIQYQITVSGVFIVEETIFDNRALLTIETANMNQPVDVNFSHFPYVISGIKEDRLTTLWVLRLTNFATIENESLPYGVIISMITLMHIDR